VETSPDGRPGPAVWTKFGGVVRLVLLFLEALSLTGDRARIKHFTPGELEVVKQVVAAFPKVAADRLETFKGVYTWEVPRLPPCGRHWGLPISTGNPLAAAYLKAIYSGRPRRVAAGALAEALRTVGSSEVNGELFCDPMTWRFWLDPFTYKLPPEKEVGEDVASLILKDEVLANRHQGFTSSAIRAALRNEVESLRGAVPAADRGRGTAITLDFDVSSPFAASANQAKSVITLSDALVRYVVVREVTRREDALREIFAKVAAPLADLVPRWPSGS
jgi:hypothetical protein